MTGSELHNESKSLRKLSHSERNKEKHKVSFGGIEVRFFPMILGDNPGGSTSGPPVTIGWEPFSTASISIDKYESRRKPRRKVEQLLLSPLHRQRMLTSVAGYTYEQVRESMREVKKIRRQRESSLRPVMLASVAKYSFEEVRESVKEGKKIGKRTESSLGLFNNAANVFKSPKAHFMQIRLR